MLCDHNTSPRGCRTARAGRRQRDSVLSTRGVITVIELSPIIVYRETPPEPQSVNGVVVGCWIHLIHSNEAISRSGYVEEIGPP